MWDNVIVSALFLAVLFIAIVIFSAWRLVRIENRRREERRELIRLNQKFENASIRSAEAETSRAAYRAADSMKSAVESIDAIDPRIADNYRQEADDAIQAARDLEREEWEESQRGHMESFLDSYLTVTNARFEDVDDLYRARTRCLKLWRTIISSADALDSDVSAVAAMRELFLDDFDPCMSTYSALEKKLNDCVNKSRPEYTRKRALYGAIVDHVCAHPGILRANLLKTPFSNATEKEVNLCYRDLVKRGSLVEVKLGSRYVVSPSDKEVQKRIRGSGKEGDSA